MAAITDSILLTVKSSLGINPDQIEFDTELCMHINSALATIRQLGVGPVEGLMIQDASATWSNLLAADMAKFAHVMQYVCTDVKLIFDPPQVGYVVTAYQERQKELAERIRINTIPDPVVVPEEGV